jgi:hypothetical protein
VTAVAGELARVVLEVVGGRAGPRALGRAVLGVGGVLGQHDLDDVQVRLEAVGEPRGPAHGPVGGLGPVGPHHHATNRSLDRGAHGVHHA